MNLTERILAAREAGHVERCHTIPHVPTYDVAQHTFNMLAMLDILHPNPSLNLYRAILWHDAAERWTGDLPARVHALREKMAELTEDVENLHKIPRPKLTDEEKSWLHALDKLEFWLWAHEEKEGRGNKSAGPYLLKETELLHGYDMPEPCRKFFSEFWWRRTEDQ